MNWIEMAQEIDQWRDFNNNVDPQDSQKLGIFDLLNNCQLLNVSLFISCTLVAMPCQK
jgi:hypothetical protein